MLIGLRLGEVVQVVCVGVSVVVGGSKVDNVCPDLILDQAKNGDSDLLARGSGRKGLRAIPPVRLELVF